MTNQPAAALLPKQNIQQTHKLHGLDTLRALAITMVFLYHYGGGFGHPDWENSISRFGWAGVDLFFVLSGFLIASQLFARVGLGKKISLHEFFIKRIFRIIPAYLLVVTLYFLFPLLREWGTPAPLWKYLTFTQNLGLDLRTQGSFSHAWSLCIEEQFYLFLPLIIVALVHFNWVKKGFIVLLLFFVLGFLARLYSWYLLPPTGSDDYGIYWLRYIYYPTYSRLDGLLVGVAIAGCFQFYPKTKQTLQRYGNALLLLSLVLLTGCYFLCQDTQSFAASIFGFPLVDCSCGVLVLAAVSPTCFLYRFKNRVLFKIAALSYAVYLTHKIVIHVTQQQFTKLQIATDSTLMFAICVTACAVVAWLVNVTVEKPFLRWRERFI